MFRCASLFCFINSDFYFENMSCYFYGVESSSFPSYSKFQFSRRTVTLWDRNPYDCFLVRYSQPLRVRSYLSALSSSFSDLRFHSDHNIHHSNFNRNPLPCMTLKLCIGWILVLKIWRVSTWANINLNYLTWPVNNIIKCYTCHLH